MESSPALRFQCFGSSLCLPGVWQDTMLSYLTIMQYSRPRPPRTLTYLPAPQSPIRPNHIPGYVPPPLFIMTSETYPPLAFIHLAPGNSCLYFVLNQWGFTPVNVTSAKPDLPSLKTRRVPEAFSWFCLSYF